MLNLLIYIYIYIYIFFFLLFSLLSLVASLSQTHFFFHSLVPLLIWWLKHLLSQPSWRWLVEHFLGWYPWKYQTFWAFKHCHLGHAFRAPLLHSDGDARRKKTSYWRSILPTISPPPALASSRSRLTVSHLVATNLAQPSLPMPPLNSLSLSLGDCGFFFFFGLFAVG